MLVIRKDKIKSCVVLIWNGGICEKVCGNFEYIFWSFVFKMFLYFLFVVLGGFLFKYFCFIIEG